MKKILLFFVLFLSLNWLVVHGHHKRHVTPPTMERTLQEPTQQPNANILNTVKVSLDAVNNRISFSTPHVLHDVDITIKLYGNQVILQQRGMTIQEGYSITFPTRAKDGKYTVILQQDNQILVKNLQANR